MFEFYDKNNKDIYDIDANFKKLTLIVEQSPVSIIVTDTNGKIEYVNSKFTELTGYSFEELKGKNPSLLRAGNMSREDFKQLWETILSGREWRGEFHNKKKNGEHFWEYALISPIINSVGEITNFIGIKENITEKKAAFTALAESENKYRELIENSADGIFITDLEANIKLANTKSCNMLGYTEEELLNMNIEDTYVNSEKEQFKRNFEELQNSGIHSYERYIKRKDNSAFPAEITVRKIKLNGFQAIIRDITNRIEHEEKILLQATMLNQVGQAIIAVNSYGIIIYFNKAAESLYGISQDEAIGRLITGILPPLEDSETAKIIGLLEKGGSWGGEISITRDKGSAIPVFLTITPVFNNESIQIGAIGISFDLSEQKRKEKELFEAKEKAEEMNKLKSSFLTNMSHELRTPMVGILGYSEVLMDEIQDLRFNEMVKSIFNSGQRLLNTLNLILDLSRVESNKMEIRFSHFDLYKLIEENVSLFQGAAIVKKIAMDFESTCLDFDIYSDGNIIHNIISNLLNNAFKFTREGYVKVTLNRESISGKEYAVICVSDSGIGIAADKQKIIFDEFRQISEGLNRSFEGTGLGLTLTKKFVSVLGGFISLDSEPGVGSKFYVYLPTNVEFQIREEEMTGKPSGVNLPTILLVEDDDISISLTKRILKNLCSVEIAKNAQAALILAEKYKYDLILMDINLGNSLNGIELTKILRQNSSYNDIPIIAFTAFAMESDKEECTSAGCSDFLSKPFTKLDLVNVIKKNLQYLSTK